MESSKVHQTMDRATTIQIEFSSPLLWWSASVPFLDEHSIIDKMRRLLQRTDQLTIDSKRREDETKQSVVAHKSSLLMQQSGALKLWLMSADCCSQPKYEQFLANRGLVPTKQEIEFINALATMINYLKSYKT